MKTETRTGMDQQPLQYYCLDVVVEDQSFFIHHFCLVRARSETQALQLAREDWAKNGRGKEISTIFTKPAPKEQEVTFLVACRQEEYISAPDDVPVQAKQKE